MQTRLGRSEVESRLQMTFKGQETLENQGERSVQELGRRSCRCVQTGCSVSTVAAAAWKEEMNEKEEPGWETTVLDEGIRSWK